MGNQLVLVSKNDLILIWLGDFLSHRYQYFMSFRVNSYFFCRQILLYRYRYGTFGLAWKLLCDILLKFFFVNSRSINFVYFLEDKEKMTSLSNLPRRIQFISVSVMNLSSMTVLWKRFSLNVFCYLSFRDSREVNVSFVNYVNTTWSVSASLLFYKCSICTYS